MGKFLNDISIPESLGKLYGKTVQAIAGIAELYSMHAMYYQRGFLPYLQFPYYGFY